MLLLPCHTRSMNKRPMGLVPLLVVITTCPDIQLSFMLHGHVAEVKYLVFLRCKFIYIVAFFSVRHFSILFFLLSWRSVCLGVGSLFSVTARPFVCKGSCSGGRQASVVSGGCVGLTATSGSPFTRFGSSLTITLGQACLSQKVPHGSLYCESFLRWWVKSVIYPVYLSFPNLPSVEAPRMVPSAVQDNPSTKSWASCSHRLIYYLLT